MDCQGRQISQAGALGRFKGIAMDDFEDLLAALKWGAELPLTEEQAWEP